MSDTIHSADEELAEHIAIKEEIVYKYRTQIILSYSPAEEMQTVHIRKIWK